jgi:hypothetical protein
MHGRLKDASAGFPHKNLGTSKSGRCFASEELVWDGLQLRLGSARGRILVTVEPDSKWPGHVPRSPRRQRHRHCEPDARKGRGDFHCPISTQLGQGGRIDDSYCSRLGLARIG